MSQQFIDLRSPSVESTANDKSEPSSLESIQTKVVKYQEGYDDQKADLTITSCDGDNFKIDSFYLKADSEVWRGMFAGCVPSRQLSLPETSQEIQIYLDYLTGSQNWEVWDNTHIAIRLADKFQSKRLEDDIARAMFVIIGDDPDAILKVFEVAAQLDHLTLGITTLRAFDRSDDQGLHPMSMPFKSAELIGAKWYWALVKACMGQPDMDQLDWDDVAFSFEEWLSD